MTVNTEVTAADIARIAGVGRAAVSNWRRRHQDFPAPIGGPPNSPTFSLTDVAAWLEANGRAAGVNPARPASTRAAGSLDDGLAEPMAALLPRRTRGTVIDPGCGDGSVLAAAAHRLGPRLRYVGQDIDPPTSEGVFEVRTGSPEAEADQLAEFRHSVAAVISVTPLTDRPIEGLTWEYGHPSRFDFALAWVQICLSYLKPGGTAIVALPFATAVRASGRRVRAELLRAGVLTRVIGLPEKIVSGAGGPWQIWVLARPAARPVYVLHMVDLADLDPDDLPRDDEAWTAIFSDPARTRDVPSIELLDEDVFLVPSAHIAAVPRDIGPEFAEHRHRYATVAARLPGVAPSVKPGDGPLSAPLVTVNDLVRSGSLTFVDRDGPQPRDVVVSAASGAFDAVVIDDVTGIETKTVSVLRCDPDTLDPHFLACFLRSETNRRQAAGTLGGTFRLDVRRARVPRLPLSEQRRYGEAFRRLMTFADSAAQVADAAKDVTRTAIYGLTSGALSPTGKWPVARESELT